MRRFRKRRPLCCPCIQKERAGPVLRVSSVTLISVAGVSLRGASPESDRLSFFLVRIGDGSGGPTTKTPCSLVLCFFAPRHKVTSVIQEVARRRLQACSPFRSILKL